MTDRKKDHIELAFQSQIAKGIADERFYYEAMLGVHPQGELANFPFLGKNLRTPIWVSSMTGGTALAAKINNNLAKACADFGMGMGLGSCRSLLDSDAHLSDFDVRDIIGSDLPLYANLGICQIENLLKKKEHGKIVELLQKLRADGLIVHVNPMQESLQPEGDMLTQPPIQSIRKLLELADYPIMVKEVGQGMGPESLRQLLELPLMAVEFAAFGGTNFAKIEMMRNKNALVQLLDPLTRIGHSAESMLNWCNQLVENGSEIKCRQLIISGGVKHFIDGYYLMEKSQIPAIYGQASELLKYAKESYDDLHSYLKTQVKGLQIARSYLRVRKEE